MLVRQEPRPIKGQLQKTLQHRSRLVVRIVVMESLPEPLTIVRRKRDHHPAGCGVPRVDGEGLSQHLGDVNAFGLRFHYHAIEQGGVEPN